MAPETLFAATHDSFDRVAPPLIVEALRMGDLALFEARLSAITGLERSRLQSIVYSTHGRDLAAVCRSLGLEKLIFASIFLLSQKARSKFGLVDPRTFSRAMAFYEELSEGAAKEIVAGWRRDEIGSG